MMGITPVVLGRLEEDREEPQKMSVTERPFSVSLRSSKLVRDCDWNKSLKIESVGGVVMVKRKSCQD